MENRKFCPLCYCLTDPTEIPELLMCEQENCMWWQNGDCICNTAVRALVLLANSTAYLKSAT